MPGGVRVMALAALAVLAVPALAGCGAPREVSLDSLLVRASDLPAGWRLLDFNNDSVDGDAAYPMATNPQSFSHAELETVNWGGTLEARAIAFVRDEDPDRGLLMFWAGRLEDDAERDDVIRTACFAGDDVLPVSGRTVAFAAAYAVDDFAVANAALASVDARTAATNACPAAVREEVAGAPAGTLGTATRLVLDAGERATFRYDLDGHYGLLARGALKCVLLDAHLARVQAASGCFWDETLPAGTYYVRLESLGDTEPPTPQEFVLRTASGNASAP